MKLLRDSLRWRVLRVPLFGVRSRAERRYTVTVPAPRNLPGRSVERAMVATSVLPGLR